MHGHYNYWIVLLSFAIAALASYSALNLAAKISRVQGRAKTGWLLLGAFVMGSGVWSMHFIGMMAFHLDIPVNYNVTVTILSMAASIVSSYIAFRITLPQNINWRNFAVGGFFMGIGIVAMHYTGMSAMRMNAMLSYDPLYWTLSALIALAASYAAMLLFIRFRGDPKASWWKGLASVVMGIAICGMHYTGMRAARFWCGTSVSGQAEPSEINLFLLIGVAVTTLVILLVSWGAMFLDRHILEKLAYSDSLTGLPNRHEMNRYFEEHAGKLSGTAVLFIDLDQFKTINDTLGHGVGDKLVQRVGERLQAFLNPDCLVFRIGGDEYLVVLKDSKPGQAEGLAENILEAIKAPYLIEENELYVTASIGISKSPEHGTDRSALLKAADTAMYNAKNAGKNRYCLFDEEMDRSLIRRMTLEKDLRKAVKQREFFIVYQPKWNAQTDRPVGFEALLRWNHGTLGIVPPEEFIPLAEETGLIVPMTRWILEEACRQNKQWIEEGMPELPVSVNLSVRVFLSRSLVDMVGQALLETGLPSRLLELEITESIVLYDLEDIVNQLKPLRDLGVVISMDDFGAGYSSLGSLDRIPIDTLKIDKTFIQESDSASKRAIIGAMIVMATQLQLNVVAEGVEKKEQIDFLSGIGCNVMQGFYYGKPMKPAEFTNWLLQHA
ncbi:EAL domain-containing protein [Cohnella sp. CFH 77786]|nr:EAL domain-containing protein [Cohnella sp. CFH 77786]